MAYSGMKLKDMAITKEKDKDYPVLSSDEGNGGPRYPYGLCLCLDDETIKKLDLDQENVEVGDMIELCGLAKVTSYSKNDTGDGPKVRVELQITHLEVEGDDEEEGED